MPYLVEIGYFKEVTFVFLVVDHTKNAADRLFNVLKRVYRKDNIDPGEEMLGKLNVSNHVTVHPTTKQEFFDWVPYTIL